MQQTLQQGPLGGVQRGKAIRWILTACLGAAIVFAAWAWFRPYAWQTDPNARCKIVETMVTRDHGFFWVDVHLKMRPGLHLDLEKPVRLLVGGDAHEPADTTLAGTPGDPDEMWYKFWVDEKSIGSVLDLQINDGLLHVKTSRGVPEIENGPYRNQTSSRW